MKKEIISLSLISLLISSNAKSQEAIVGFPMVKTITNYEETKEISPNTPTLTETIKEAKESKEAKTIEKSSKEIENKKIEEENPYKKYSKEEESSFSIKGFQLGVGIGALGGVNAQLGYRIPQDNKNFWKNRFGFRIDYNTWAPLESYIDDYMKDNPIEIDGNDLTAKIEGKQIGGLIDFYPFGNTWGLGNFRISGGYYTGDFSIGASLHRNANETFKIEDETGKELTYKVKGDATLSAMLDYDVTGPYAGIGLDFGLFWGLKMYFDAGLVFTDKPEINTDITGTGNIEICDGSSCETTTIDTSNEEIQQLLNDTKREYEKELDDLRQGYFPIIKFGVLFRF